LLCCERNLGAAARNLGVRAATTPHVAFSDDVSWWAKGALERAADVLDQHPSVSLVAARVLVGCDERLDPTSAAMAVSPLVPAAGLPGTSVLGFLACGAVVRRDAFLAVGGFDDVLFFLGEEELVAYDLAARGTTLVYLEEVVAHHHPGPARDAMARRTRQHRNRVLSAVMRRPLRVIAVRAWPLAFAAPREPWARDALVETVRLLPRALRRRRRPVARVERKLRLLERSPASA
jgi:GT2 family glycosyltransferase